MSQSSKCNEHRRLHNAKSPSLIEDTVARTCLHTLIVSISHAHINASVLSLSEPKNMFCHKDPEAEEPPSHHKAPPPGSGSPVLHAHTLLFPLFLSPFSLSLSELLSYTCTDAAALSQPVWEEGS